MKHEECPLCTCEADNSVDYFAEDGSEIERGIYDLSDLRKRLKVAPLVLTFAYILLEFVQFSAKVLQS